MTTPVYSGSPRLLLDELLAAAASEEPVQAEVSSGSAGAAPLGPVQIPYGAGLSQVAIGLRRQLADSMQRVGPGRNVAVARIKKPTGTVTRLHAISLAPEKNKPGLHAEQLLVRELARQRVKPAQVIELYSELEFCPTCLAATGPNIFPNARRYFSFLLRDYNQATNTIDKTVPYNPHLRRL